MVVKPIDCARPLSLSAAVQAEIDRLRPLSRGPRTAAEWSRYRQRMAEIVANHAIEDMHVTPDEAAFLELAFSLNLEPEVERALCRTWIAGNLKGSRRILESAE